MNYEVFDIGQPGPKREAAGSESGRPQADPTLSFNTPTAASTAAGMASTATAATPAVGAQHELHLAEGVPLDGEAAAVETLRLRFADESDEESGEE